MGGRRSHDGRWSRGPAPLPEALRRLDAANRRQACQIRLLRSRRHREALAAARALASAHAELERRVEERTEHLQAVTATAHEAIVSADSRGHVIDANAATERLFGYSHGELVGRPITSIMPERFRDAHHAGFARFLATGEAHLIGRTVGFTGRCRDGREVSLEVSLTCWTAGGERFFTAIMRDVTERLQAEEVLRRSQAQLADAQEIAHLGSWEWDLASDGITWSDELYRIHGLARAPLADAAPLLALLHPEDRSRVQALVQALPRTRGSFGFEYRILLPDGMVRTLHARGRVVVDADDRPLRIAGTAQDISERRQVEQRLLISDRMASVGTLAAGVTHEINNPLAYVIGNLEVALQELPPLLRAVTAAAASSPAGAIPDLDPTRLADVLDALTEARQGAERVRQIVRDMKVFARADDERVDRVELPQVIDSAVSMAWNEIRHRARLVKEYGPVPPVEGSESRLGQVVLNLLVNAAHAITEGSAETNEIRVATSTDGQGRALIEVRDTGAGIAPEARHRIFDPYVTTKEIGVGTGLGLSICHGIVAAMGGTIQVESNPGAGTTFRVTLPAASVAALPPELAPVAEAAPRRCRILVVDDEPLIAAMLRRVLAPDHEVVAAESGREALQRLVENRERFDLVLCDLMMPEMTGMDVHAALAERAPREAERLVFVTGGAFTPRAQAFLARVPNRCLDKPIDVLQLRALVQGLFL